jgi:hypothetical protein
MTTPEYTEWELKQQDADPYRNPDPQPCPICGGDHRMYDCARIAGDPQIIHPAPTQEIADTAAIGILRHIVETARYLPWQNPVPQKLMDAIGQGSDLLDEIEETR